MTSRATSSQCPCSHVSLPRPQLSSFQSHGLPSFGKISYFKRTPRKTDTMLGLGQMIALILLLVWKCIEVNPRRSKRPLYA
ncbi:hypothetical protein BDZ85DRAFT_102018 [Elsinoe ampelina]|uniref:Uncharacterized protein n=1 Tax=Elsinoe ampelina TaxID=302913 RepID=A0A6A6GFV9_9PEZI|nr:hypothetical protein BDZ85DRAFT_102018 [Elsinoe ampelina]